MRPAYATPHHHGSCGFGPRFVAMTGRRRHGRRPPFGPWGGGFGPGSGRKAGRGDIRAAILALLTEEPMHGYQIIREITERSDGAWRPSPGSVYPTLQQLADEGLIKTTETDGRRVHELTDDGREQAGAREGAAPWQTAADETDDSHVALREVGFGVISAAREVAQTGTDEQLKAAQDILREARKRLYRLLADEE
jgi:DNA-binding PadR family transcriptional regulator